jgi:hypothetical protein
MIKMVDIIRENNYTLHNDIENGIYNIQNDEFIIQGVRIVNRMDVNYGVILTPVLKKLTPDTINIIYSEVSKVINGLTKEIKHYMLSIDEISLSFDNLRIETFKLLPRDIINSMRYGEPTVKEILNGEYSLVIPRNVFMDMKEEYSLILKSKRKLGQVYYDINKKGKILDHTYELLETPSISVIYTGGVKTQFNPSLFEIKIVTSFTKIDGVDSNSKNFNSGLIPHLSEVLSLKFKRLNLDITFK